MFHWTFSRYSFWAQIIITICLFICQISCMSVVTFSLLRILKKHTHNLPNTFLDLWTKFETHHSQPIKLIWLISNILKVLKILEEFKLNKRVLEPPEKGQVSSGHNKMLNLGLHVQSQWRQISKFASATVSLLALVF